MLPNDRILSLFGATIQAVEEAILNCLVAAETMAGIKWKYGLYITPRSLKRSAEKIQSVGGVAIVCYAG